MKLFAPRLIDAWGNHTLIAQIWGSGQKNPPDNPAQVWVCIKEIYFTRAGLSEPVNVRLNLSNFDPLSFFHIIVQKS